MARPRPPHPPHPRPPHPPHPPHPKKSNNLTFLRGTVISDSKGLAVFQTIVPGWYPGKKGVFSNNLFCDGSMHAAAWPDKPALQPVCGLCVRELRSYVLVPGSSQRCAEALLWLQGGLCTFMSRWGQSSSLPPMQRMSLCD